MQDVLAVDLMALDLLPQNLNLR